VLTPVSDTALAAAPAPIAIDEPGLFRLAEAGYRWTEGHVGPVRFRWLLPPGWVGAGSLPPTGRGGIERLRGVGDRAGRFTAVLGVLRGCSEAPHQLLARSAAPGATISVFSSLASGGPVAERIERRDGRTAVTTVHGFTAGGEAYRFFISAVGPSDSAADQPGFADAGLLLRTLGTALALSDDLLPAHLPPLALAG
jgi:hypothetical protein